MKKVVLLGATGSIGKSSVDLIRQLKDDFSLVGISANTNKARLDKIKNEFSCKSTLTSQEGNEGIASLLDEAKPDIVINGIAGAAGLLPSKLVVERGVDIALANKETIVMAWHLIKEIADKNGAKIIPIDSEHSAIWTLIEQCGKENIKEIIITASGGPFRDFSLEKLKTVTVKDALNHPTWSMGKKITVDSATLANKGLEVIEATHLFNVNPNKIKVVVHPQSFVHSLVRTNDNMLYAQISEPDMKHPILNALTYPKIFDTTNCGMQEFSLYGKTMSFFEPRYNDFPLLNLAFDVAKKSGAWTIAFNAADEVASYAFINGKISFTRISEIVLEVLQNDWNKKIETFDDVFFMDKKAREEAGKLI